MLEWVKRRAKTRKYGRMVLITSVVFDADVFNELCKYITRDDGQRSDIINKALRDSLATPGWIESAREDQLKPKSIAFKPTQPPSSNSRIHARGGIEGPKTKRSPRSRPPKSKTCVSACTDGLCFFVGTAITITLMDDDRLLVQIMGTPTIPGARQVSSRTSGSGANHSTATNNRQRYTLTSVHAIG